jgi:uncharacterized protein (TIGR04255 family)
MSTLQAVDIKPEEKFENLPRAPIVEAVIEIRARATNTLEESSLRSALEPRLAGYSFLDSLREFHSEVKLEGGKPLTQKVSDVGWKGVRFRSSDEKHIVQFNRDSFVFSRLEPYLTWDQLFGESQRLWAIFKAVAQPADIQRIGLRYINRIKLPPGELRFEDFIQPAPSTPRELNLPFDGFMHYDTLAVPEHPFAINVIRTVQRPSGAGDAGVALILDIDVFTTQGFDVDDAFFGQRLLEMRWLKNKVFFGSITEKSLEMFRC